MLQLDAAQLELAIVAAGAIGNVVVTYAAVRGALRYVLREVNRAHRRLDKINAPAMTDERALDFL